MTKVKKIQDHSDKGDLKEVFGESKQLCRKWSPHISKLVSTTGEPLKKKKKGWNVGPSTLSIC